MAKSKLSLPLRTPARESPFPANFTSLFLSALNYVKNADLRMVFVPARFEEVVAAGDIFVTATAQNAVVARFFSEIAKYEATGELVILSPLGLAPQLCSLAQMYSIRHQIIEYKEGGLLNRLKMRNQIAEICGLNLKNAVVLSNFPYFTQYENILEIISECGFHTLFGFDRRYELFRLQSETQEMAKQINARVSTKNLLESLCDIGWEHLSNTAGQDQTAPRGREKAVIKP